MRVMRETISVLMLLTMATPAAAQWSAIEVGVGISRACIGSEGGLCGTERGPMWATTASAWINDRVEIGIRLAEFSLDDWNYSQEHDSRFDHATDPIVRSLSRVDISVRERSRRILSGEAIYHFARGRPLRGFLGGGLGQLNNRGVQTCEPAGCELAMRLLSSPVGRYDRVLGNMTIIAGLSGRLNRRLYLRGGVRLHNFAGEGLSTSETFIATSYRFGRN